MVSLEEIFRAVAVVRNGGVPSQSGLVGITNKTLNFQNPSSTGYHTQRSKLLEM